MPRSEAIKGLLKPAKTKGPAPEEESPDVVNVVDMVQTHCLSGDSVLLAVRSQFQGGDIFIYRGEVYHAQYPGKSGEAAFTDILRWDGGLAAGSLDQADPYAAEDDRHVLPDCCSRR